MSIITKSTGPLTTIATTQLYRYTGAACAPTGSPVPVAGSPPEDKIRSYYYSWMEGRTTPGWQKLRNSGHLLPMTVFKRFESSSEAIPAEREYCETPTSNRRFWDNFTRDLSNWHRYASASELMALFSEPDLEYYVQKAAAAIYSGGWDAATFLAEITQLRRMLQGIGGKLDSLLRGQSPGAAHDLWLEGRYGWRTLMFDIRDLHELLTAVKEKRTRYRHQSGHTSVSVWNDDWIVSSNGTHTQMTESITQTLNVRGTVVADIDVPDLQFNPVITAWEVTKLSFVVDWLLNVGQALSAASFLLKAKSYVACGGYKAEYQLEGTCSNAGTYGGAVSYAESGGYSGTISYEERIPMTISALPRIKLRLNEWKIIDLISLIRQRL